MSKWLGIVCVVACFGIGCGDDDVTPETDAGPTPDVPVAMDTGAVEEDAGMAMEDTGVAPSCEFDGTYGVTADPANPALCAAADIESCELETIDGVPTVTCTLNDPEADPVSGECTYNADCVCEGSAEVSGIPLMIAGDFPNMTLSADAAGMTCNFTLVSM